MADWIDDPEAQEWVKHVLDELVPKLKASSVTVSLVPDGPSDVKFAVELGMSIMLDKPIILAVRPGVQIPDHLRRVADEIVDFSNPANLAEAINRVVVASITKEQPDDS